MCTLLNTNSTNSFPQNSNFCMIYISNFHLNYRSWLNKMPLSNHSSQRKSFLNVLNRLLLKVMLRWRVLSLNSQPLWWGALTGKNRRWRRREKTRRGGFVPDGGALAADVFLFSSEEGWKRAFLDRSSTCGDVCSPRGRFASQVRGLSSFPCTKVSGTCFQAGFPPSHGRPPAFPAVRPSLLMLTSFPTAANCV